MEEYNCFKVRHYVSSIIICAIFFVAWTFSLITALSYPAIFNSIYMIGATDEQIKIGVASISVFLLIANNCLAYGIAQNWALFLLIWIIISVIVWKLHFILYLCSFSYAMIHINTCDSLCATSLFILFIFCVLWLLSILLVARHWYAVCEELYIQEYGSRPGRNAQNRIITFSNRNHMPNVASQFSTRISHLIERIS